MASCSLAHQKQLKSASAGCEYAAVERVNKEAVLPLLRDLVRTPFFRYFKVNLYCDCPFWPDDGMCMLRDCGVCECEPDEVPAPWKVADTAANCEGEHAGSLHASQATACPRLSAHTGLLLPEDAE